MPTASHFIQVGDNTFVPTGGYDLFLAKLGESTSIKDINLESQLHSLSIAPNPVHSKTLISYYLNSDSDVIIEIYDVNGILIHRPVDKFQQIGQQEAITDLSTVQPGIYFCVIKTNNEIYTKKIINFQKFGKKKADKSISAYALC